jgi:hypothetical protein
MRYDAVQFGGSLPTFLSNLQSRFEGNTRRAHVTTQSTVATAGNNQTAGFSVTLTSTRLSGVTQMVGLSVTL